MSTVILSYNICKYIYLKLKVGKLINYIVGYVDIIRISETWIKKREELLEVPPVLYPEWESNPHT